MGPQLSGNGPTKQGDFKPGLKSVKDPLKPLRHRSFYLDLKEYKGIQALKEDILLLGGVLENFISKEVSCVITNKPVNKADVNGNSGNAQNTQSPIFSPATDSPSTSDTPTEDRRKMLMSRGNKMLEKAIRVVKGTGDVLQNAQKWGVQVETLPRFLTWLENYKAKNNIRKIKNDKKKRTPQNQQDKSIIHLMEPFLKFEAVSRQYRPVYKQLRKWPELIFDSNSCTSPFSHNIHGTDNRRQTGTKHSVRSEHELNRSQQSAKIIKSNNKDKKLLGFKRKHGYCEICSVPYTHLFKHLETSQHQKFVSDEKNYASLDKVIASGSELSDYLESLKLNTSNDEVKLLTPVAPMLVTRTVESHVTPPSPQVSQNCDGSPYTPNQCTHENESTFGCEEKAGKIYMEISQDIFPVTNNSGESYTCREKAVDIDTAATRSDPHVESGGPNEDYGHPTYSGFRVTTSTFLPDVNQSSASTCISGGKLDNCANMINVPQMASEMGAAASELLTLNPAMKKSLKVDQDTLSFTKPVPDQSSQLKLVGNVNEQDVDMSESTTLTNCIPPVSEPIVNVAYPGTQSSNSYTQVDASCSLLNSVECKNDKRKVDVVHKTLRSTVHKRSSFLQQFGVKTPLDLSMKKRERLEERMPVLQPCKKSKLELSCERSSLGDSSSPLAPKNVSIDDGEANITGDSVSVAQEIERLNLNSTRNSMNGNLNFVSSLDESFDTMTIHTSNIIVSDATNADKIAIAQVKADSESKSRSALILTDHSMRALFNSDNETSDFLGFDSKDCQDLPLDLSYTEIPESSSLASNVLSSEKECNSERTSILSDAIVTNHDSDCSVGSGNDEIEYGENNQDAMHETSESSETWDHDINLFLDKHVSNTVTVK